MASTKSTAGDSVAFSPSGTWQQRRDLLAALPRRAGALLAADFAATALPAFEERHPDDGRPRAAIAAARAWALDPSEANRDAAYVASAASATASAAASAAAYAAAYAANAASSAASAAYAAFSAAYAASSAANAASAYAARWTELLALYRRCRGPLGVAFDPEWRTGTAVAVAERIAATGELEHAPILADALQDAGCDRPDVLDHLRDGTAALSDWTLWNLLGLGCE